MAGTHHKARQRMGGSLAMAETHHMQGREQAGAWLWPGHTACEAKNQGHETIDKLI